MYTVEPLLGDRRPLDVFCLCGGEEESLIRQRKKGDDVSVPPVNSVRSSGTHACVLSERWARDRQSIPCQCVTVLSSDILQCGCGGAGMYIIYIHILYNTTNHKQQNNKQWNTMTSNNGTEFNIKRVRGVPTNCAHYTVMIIVCRRQADSSDQ